MVYQDRHGVLCPDGIGICQRLHPDAPHSFHSGLAFVNSLTERHLPTDGGGMGRFQHQHPQASRPEPMHNTGGKVSPAPDNDQVITLHGSSLRFQTLQKDFHGAAAGRNGRGIAGPLCGKGGQPARGSPRLQQFPRQLLGAVLHDAAAHAAHGRAIGQYQHLGALLPWRRAMAAYDGRQHRRSGLLFQRGQQRRGKALGLLAAVFHGDDLRKNGKCDLLCGFCANGKPNGRVQGINALLRQPQLGQLCVHQSRALPAAIMPT